MGGWITHLWWGGDPDVSDPFSKLTKREIYLVQKSWATVYGDAVTNGTEIFRRLFTTYPDTKEFFKKVRHLPEEKFIYSPQFKAHVINLMTSLNQAIVNLNQPEISAAIMNKLGETHQKRKIQDVHFMNFKEIMMQLFVEVHLDNQTLAAWDKAVQFLYQHIFQTLNEKECS